MDRMKQLIDILNNASKHYYQLADTIITDYEYDKLYDELVALEEKTGITLSGSPTKNVGYTVLSGLTKIKHDSRMLSLDKTKEIGRLKEWIGNKEGILSWKLDGLTIVLKYNDGELIQAVTRGNGEIGEDITHNAKVFKNLPVKIAFEGEMVLRGEGVIAYSEFKKINEELSDEEKYKNPRNLCSGTVRQLNNEIAAKRNVMFYAFSLVSANGKEFDDFKIHQMDWLSSLGFDVVEHKLVTEETIEGAIKEFEEKITENDFASDGLVLTYNSISYGKSLGETSKFPKDSIAFKWADETAETILRKIDWSTSRTGLINPIAVFDPVELEGTTVNRASVHNLSILKELKLGIGDTIKVYKANMIIPQIAENITKKDNIEIPKVCPVCDGETEVRRLKDGEALYCTNPNCNAQIIKSLVHFASRDAMNIEGLSEETLKKFVKNGFIENYTDIFILNKFEEEIKAMEGFGEKSYNNLISAIEKAKNVQLPNFIYSLGINQVGLNNAKLLCKNAKYKIENIKELTEEELIEIDGFGQVIAHSIKSYFSSERNLILLENALQYITPQKVEEAEEDLRLKGVNFVITGDVEHFKNRKELQEKIEALGGKVTGSVTSKTNYLINNDTFSASSKNKKAKELGVPIITENQFIQQFLNL
ncbi:MAG: NAD-dependent DNA ligase LigA [Lachnospiraceae bacterium]|nr:NAD-dependent DNA ligase LigA [Lachnospiraceae bacterium]